MTVPVLQPRAKNLQCSASSSLPFLDDKAEHHGQAAVGTGEQAVGTNVTYSLRCSSNSGTPTKGTVLEVPICSRQNPCCSSIRLQKQPREVRHLYIITHNGDIRSKLGANSQETELKLLKACKLKDFLLLRG